jgi:endonuclease YncB( thermonuclease family)
MRSWPLAATLLLVGCPLSGPDPTDDDDAANYDPWCLPAGVDPASEPLKATLRTHVDGDTAVFQIDGIGREYVRFLSVNTPEVSHGQTAADCYGETASDLTEERIPTGSTVWLTFGPELRDGFDRVLAYIHLGETPSCTDYDDWVNLTMVSEGEGCEFIWDDNQNWLDLFRAAEAEARDNDRGLWGRCRDATDLCR